jgi:hypothetical protein
MAAMATFCFCPPDRVLISRWRKWPMPIAKGALQALLNFPFWHAEVFQAVQSSSSTTEFTHWLSMS